MRVLERVFDAGDQSFPSLKFRVPAIEKLSASQTGKDVTKSIDH